MKNYKQLILLGVLILFVGLFTGAATTEAIDNGGQVTVEGGITFVENSGTSPSTSFSGVPDDGGKLPQTGEVIRHYGFIGVGLLLLLIIIAFYRKKRGRDADK